MRSTFGAMIALARGAATIVMVLLSCSFVAAGGSCPLPTTGLVQQLETDSGVATTGSTVTGWSDQTAQSNDLSASGNPQLLIGALNGMDVIAFDGVNDCLDRVATLNGFSTGNSDRTVLALVRYFDNTQGGPTYGNSDCNQAFGLGVAANGNLRLQGWCPENDFATSEFATGTGWLIQSVVLDSSELRHYRDGFLVGTDTHAFNTVATRMMIGGELDGSAFTSLEIAAVLVYDTALSNSDREAAEAYLRDKYLAIPCGSNLVPRADDDSAAVASAGSVVIDVLGGDEDLDGSIDATSVAIVEMPQRGTVSVDPVTGAVTYTHGGGADIVDYFRYTVDDNGGATSNVAEVGVAIGDPTCALVPLGLVLALEAESGVMTSGSTVTSWEDQSPAANDLLALGDPTLVPGVLNGQPVIEFDGTADLLERTTGLTDLPVDNANRSMFVVVNYESDGFGGVAYGTPSCNQAFGLSVDGSGDLTLTKWCADFDTANPGNGAGWLVQSALVQFGRFSHFQNAVLIDVGNHDFGTVASAIRVGSELDANPTLDMDVAAILLYDRALSPEEHSQVLGYLRKKYFDDPCGAAPVADDDTADVARLGSVQIDILAGDTDDSAIDPTTVVIVDPPTQGVISVDPLTGVVTYQHNTESLVAERFTYTVNDTEGAVSNVATVSIGINHPDCPRIESGLVLRVESGVGVSQVGNVVSSWSDLSPLGNDLSSQGDPEWIPNALNGHPVIRLDGINDKLERALGLSGMPTGNSDRTVFAVVNYVGTGPGGIGWGIPACNQAFLMIVLPNGDLMLTGWCGANSFNTLEPGTGAGWFSSAVRLSSGSYAQYKDGVLLDSGSHTFNTAMGSFVVGTESDCDPLVEMDVAEILVYDRALTEVERMSVEDYLHEKYFGPVCCVPVSITAAPMGQTVCEGDDVTFSVDVAGTPLFDYQWRFNGVEIPGATDSTLQIFNVNPSEAGSYDVLVTNECGTETSAAADLVVRTAPVISMQPSGATECEGATVLFDVSATGSAPLTYQWFFEGVAISGADMASLSVGPIGTIDAGAYTVLVSNDCGDVTSAPAVLDVLTAPAVTMDPIDSTVCPGAAVTFEVSALGSPTLTYQWRRDMNPISGATSPTLMLPSVLAADAGAYDCIVSNGCGDATSASAQLVVQSLPQVVSSPGDLTVCPGDPVLFSVTATGSEPLSYQWRRDGVAIAGATLATFSIASAVAGDAGSYDCVVTNPCGDDGSAPAVLTVSTLPEITTDPIAATVCPGADVTLTVAASGSAPLSFQWRRNGLAVPGATTATLLLSAVTDLDAGDYDCVVMNPCGMDVSAVATVAVLEAPTVTMPPMSQSACPGDNVTFTVAASGAAPLSFQWRLNGVMIPGAVTDMLQLMNVSAGDAGLYDCVVSNVCGSDASATAQLTVLAATEIVTDPIGGLFCEGLTVTLSVVATGEGMLTYQWRRAGVAIPGADQDIFSIPNVQLADADTYDVVVTGACGSVTSAAATVLVEICLEPFSRGDCSADGQYNIADAIVALGALFPSGAPPVLTCLDACDCNDDGEFNLADAVCMLGGLFGPTTVPPAAPHPGCGVDPTDTDPLDCALYGNCP